MKENESNSSGSRSNLSNGSAIRSELGKVWLPVSKYMTLLFLGSRKRRAEGKIWVT